MHFYRRLVRHAARSAGGIRQPIAGIAWQAGNLQQDIAEIAVNIKKIAAGGKQDRIKIFQLILGLANAVGHNRLRQQRINHLRHRQRGILIVDMIIGIGDPDDNPAGGRTKLKLAGGVECLQGVLRRITASMGVLLIDILLELLHIGGKLVNILNNIQKGHHPQAEVDSPEAQAVGKFDDIIFDPINFIGHTAGYVEHKNNIRLIHAAAGIFFERILRHHRLIFIEKDVLIPQVQQRQAAGFRPGAKDQVNLRKTGADHGIDLHHQAAIGKWRGRNKQIAGHAV